MIFRVYSQLLDQNKTWFALNDRLCSKSPRRFGENNLFRVFPHEIRRVNIADLNDANGDPASKEWFNRLDGRNGTEYVFVGTAFAVVAGNLGLKSPVESEFFQSEAFSSLKCAINSHDLQRASETKSRGTEVLCKEVMLQPTHNQSTIESPGDTTKETSGCPGETKIECPPNSPESPPKCSTPTRESPPNFPSPFETCSFLDDSLQSCSSISEIEENPSYAPAYKKRKIRQKVEAVMGNVETTCMEQGETLGELIARACLFKRKKDIDGKGIISRVFSKVLMNSCLRSCGKSEYT